MNISFSPKAWEDYQYWQNNDKRTLKQAHALMKDIQRNPWEGIGKPERLKHHLTGLWSRRINEQHRLIYTVNKSGLVIVQLRYHYGR